LSNEDIRAFCEDGRKKARKRAVERALDAEMLEGRLRNIPDTSVTPAPAPRRGRTASPATTTLSRPVSTRSGTR
ncbi:hypothetical protein KBZ21_39935, partial [Streptomyces sp. A73]|nr:hypothetical protein [Streptomyces sp. A73]